MKALGASAAILIVAFCALTIRAAQFARKHGWTFQET